MPKQNRGILRPPFLKTPSSSSLTGDKSARPTDEERQEPGFSVTPQSEGREDEDYMSEEEEQNEEGGKVDENRSPESER